jgi:hypothetical protein
VPPHCAVELMAGDCSFRGSPVSIIIDVDLPPGTLSRGNGHARRRWCRRNNRAEISEIIYQLDEPDRGTARLWSADDAPTRLPQQ